MADTTGFSYEDAAAPTTKKPSAAEQLAGGFSYDDAAGVAPKSNIRRGVETAARQIPQTAAGALALGADAVGQWAGGQGLDPAIPNKVRDFGLEQYKGQADAIQAQAQPSDSFSNVLEGEGNLGDFLGYGAGYVGGQAATALATGGIGGLVGRQVAARGVGNMVGKAAAQRLAAGEVAGQTAALGGLNVMQEAGSIYPEAVEQAHAEGRELSPADLMRVGGAAVGAAAVETLTDTAMLRGLTKGASSAPTLAGRAARTIPLATAREASTEALQTGIERFGAGQELTGAEATRDYVDSAALGGVGGALGGAAGSVKRVVDTPTAPPVVVDPNAGPVSRAAALLAGPTAAPPPGEVLVDVDGTLMTPAQADLQRRQQTPPQGDFRDSARATMPPAPGPLVPRGAQPQDVTDVESRPAGATSGTAPQSDLGDGNAHMRPGTPQPEDMERRAAIDLAAHGASTSPHNDLPEPTDAQKKAGNYAKGHIPPAHMHGLDVTIENARGSERRGKRPDGTEWAHSMSDHYGYIRRTKGADDEQVDAYIGSTQSDRVFVVDQIDQGTGAFDEHKVMLDYPDEQTAVQAYSSNFDAGWKVGKVTSMTVPEFKEWLKNADLKKEAAATFTGTRAPDALPAAPAGDPQAAAGAGAQPGGLEPAAAPAAATVTPEAPPTTVENARHFGKGGTLMTEGGKPFKTRIGAQQQRASGEHPWTKIVPVPGGFAIRDLTDAERTAVEANGKKRQAGARAAARDKNPFMAFLAEHGLYHRKGDPKSLKTEFSPDRQVMVGGHSPVFRKDGKPLDLLLQNAIEDGFLPQDADESALYELVARTMRGDRVAPMYREGGAEAEFQRLQGERDQAAPAVRFEDFEDFANIPDGERYGDFDPAMFGLTDEDMQASGYDDLTPAEQLEFQQLLAFAEASGIDTFSILHDAADLVPSNAPRSVYAETARNLIEEALARSSDRGEQGAGQQGSEAGPQLDAAADERGEAAGGRVPEEVAPDTTKGGGEPAPDALPEQSAPPALPPNGGVFPIEEGRLQRERRERMGEVLVDIDAAKFRDYWEGRRSDEKLEWNPGRSENIAKLLAAGTPINEHPQVAVNAAGGVDVGDGRHRINYAATHGMTIRVSMAPADVAAAEAAGLVVGKPAAAAPTGDLFGAAPAQQPPEKPNAIAAGKAKKAKVDPESVGKVDPHDGEVDETLRGYIQDSDDRAHLQAALAAGKHPVTGKPMATDEERLRFQTELENLDIALAEAEAFLNERNVDRVAVLARLYQEDEASKKEQAEREPFDHEAFQAGVAKRRAEQQATLDRGEFLPLREDDNPLGGKLKWTDNDASPMKLGDGRRFLLKTERGNVQINLTWARDKYAMWGSEAFGDSISETGYHSLLSGWNMDAGRAEPLETAKAVAAQLQEKLAAGAKKAARADKAAKKPNAIAAGKAKKAGKAAPDSEAALRAELTDIGQRLDRGKGGNTGTKVSKKDEATLRARMEEIKAKLVALDAADAKADLQAGLDDLKGVLKPDAVVNGRPRDPSTPAAESLLLMACSDGKLAAGGRADTIYTGPMWQTLRANLPQDEDAQPEVLILSAKHGLMNRAQELKPYDESMTEEKAQELIDKINDPNGAAITQMLVPPGDGTFKDVQIVGGALYRKVMRAAVAQAMKAGWVAPDASIRETTGVRDDGGKGIGIQREQLGAYLKTFAQAATTGTLNAATLDAVGAEFGMKLGYKVGTNTPAKTGSWEHTSDGLRVAVTLNPDGTTATAIRSRAGGKDGVDNVKVTSREQLATLLKMWVPAVQGKGKGDELATLMKEQVNLADQMGASDPRQAAIYAARDALKQGDTTGAIVALRRAADNGKRWGQAGYSAKLHDAIDALQPPAASGQEDTMRSVLKGVRGQVPGEPSERPAYPTPAHEAAALIAAHREKFGADPKGMALEDFKKWAKDRTAATRALEKKLLELANRDDGLLLPMRHNDNSMVALHLDPRNPGQWRTTNFTKDMEPTGHMEFSKPEDAAASFLTMAGRDEKKAAAPAFSPKKGDRVVYMGGDEPREATITGDTHVIDGVAMTFVTVDGEIGGTGVRVDELRPIGSVKTAAPPPPKASKKDIDRDTEQRRSSATGTMQQLAERAREKGATKLADRLDYLATGTSAAGKKGKGNGKALANATRIAPAQAAAINAKFPELLARALANPEDAFHDVDFTATGRRASPQELKAKADLMAGLADLGSLLHKKAGGRASITPEEEAQLLPVLTRIFDAAFRLGYIKFKQAAKFVLSTVSEQLGDEVADVITIDHLQGAYIGMAGKYRSEGADTAKAVVGVESKEEIAAEPDHVPDTTGSVERDSGEPAADADVGASLPSGPGGNGAQAVRPADGDGEGGQRQQDDPRLPAGGPAVVGVGGDQRLPAGKQPHGPAGGPAGDFFGDGGGEPGDDGIQPEREPAGSPDARAEHDARQAEKRAAQRRANDVAVKPGDADNIAATVPYLTEGQQQDVLKAETRFAKPDGYGMLFTNGTGTGKTFSGLGIAARAYRGGKKNILFIVPDEKIGDDWIESGSRLALPITRLPDTKTAGEGPTLTTYANLGQNDELARRDWDMVIVDEAHSLMQSADGDRTLYLQNLQGITLHPDGARTRYEMLNREAINEAAALRDEIKGLEQERTADATTDMRRADLARRIDKLEARLKPIDSKLDAARSEVLHDVTIRQGEKRPRVTFLSATPFAYEKTVDWANGYLFDYGPEPEDRGYNTPDARGAFFIQHFGYRMRYGKLTEPDSKVDRGLMQRQFNGWLRKQGVLSMRMLDVDADYDRRFVLVSNAIGNRIDSALEWLSDHAYGEQKIAGMTAVRDHVDDQFDYLTRRYLLEAIKAKEVVPIVKQHLALGRKVVVFHDYNKGGGFNPFDFPEAKLPVKQPREDDKKFQADLERAKDFNTARTAFRAAFPELIGADFDKLRSPIEEFRASFGDELLLINGLEKKKDVLRRYTRIQDDGSGPLVALVQADKNKGWSGHDTTGKSQRVLINLGLPTQPTRSIQQEGRIYRMGNISDAIFRYLNTGTNWEKWAFATTIAQRAGAAENLSMGEQARALKDSYIAAFEEADDYPPGHEGEGKGGKERDRAAAAALSEWDRAKAFYYGTQKKNGRTKAQEGKDYFATPEPVGLKMVEWAGGPNRGGEDWLEPSGGHGAIARWFGETTNRTAIEPSASLRSRLAMVFDGKIIEGTFEDHNVVNKYDAIVMNPPFGVGGKTAVEHLAKAATHAREGARIVALLPRGPAADKRLAQFLDGEEERKATALGTTSRTPEGYYVGDIVQLDGQPSTFRVLGAGPDGVSFMPANGTRPVTFRSHYIARIVEKGPRTEKFSPADGLHLVADILLPTSTFERAGTSVAAHIIVLQKGGKGLEGFTPIQRDFSGIDNINELFNRLENLSLPERPQKTEAEAAQQSAPVRQQADAVQLPPVDPSLLVTVTTSKGKELRGVIRTDLTREQAKAIDPFTWIPPGHQGFFIREKYLKGGNVAREESAVYRVRDPGSNYDVDLFPESLDVLSGGQGAMAMKKGGKKAAKPAEPALTPNVLALRESPRMPGLFHVSSQLVQVATRNLHTASVNNWEEAAQALSELSRWSVEHFDVLITDADGRPLAIVGSFKGATTQAAVFPGTIVMEAARIQGAKYAWGVHNHPSGASRLSRADEMLTATIFSAFSTTNVEYMGTAAVARKEEGRIEWSAIDGDETPYSGSFAAATSSPAYPVAIVEREIVGVQGTLRAAGNPTEAMMMARQVSGGRAGFMLLNAQNAMTAWIPADVHAAPHWNRTEWTRFVNSMADASTSNVIVVDPVANADNARASNTAASLKTRLSLLDIRLLDMVAPAHEFSLASKGLMESEPLNPYTPDEAVKKQEREAAALKKEAEPAKPEKAKGKAPTQEQVDLFNPQGSLFRQGDQPLSPEQRRAVGELQQHVDALTELWKNAPRVTVVASVASPSVPLQVQRDAVAAMRRGGGQPAGVFYNGEVLLFADAIDSIEYATRIVYHEVLGHHGLRGYFGPGLDKVLEHVANLRGADIREMIRRTGMDPSDPASRTRAADEVLAYLAETRPELALVQRAIAAIRTFLRDHIPGFANLALSDAEIVRNYILPARGFIERGGPGGGGGQRFAQGEGNAPFYSAMQRALESLPQASLPAVGWKGAINALVNKGNVKADEVEWSGVMDWLDTMQAGAAGAAKVEASEGPDSPFTELWKSANPRKITKDAVLDFLQANGVRVEEVMKGGRQQERFADSAARQLDDLVVRADALGFTFDRATFDEADGHFARPVRFTRRDDSTTWRYNPGANGWELDDWIPEGDADPKPPQGAIDAIATDVSQLVADEVEGADPDDGTKFGQYRQPGGDNYRELLLMLPDEARPADIPAPLTTLPDGWEVSLDTSQPEGRQWAAIPPSQNHGRPYGGLRAATPEEARAGALAILNSERENGARDRVRASAYRNSHWAEKNVLAHIRTTDRVDADGKRVLFVEELQSDWGQSARKHGTRGAGDSEPFTQLELEQSLVRARAVVAANDDLGFDGTGEALTDLRGQRGINIAANFDLDAEDAATIQRYLDIDRERREWRQRTDQAVPRAPFIEKTDAWLALAIKRVIKLAVDGGYDKVAFATGAQQLKNYPTLRSQVDRIDYVKNPDGTYEVHAIALRGRSVSRDDLDAAGVAELVGQEIADRIIADEGTLHASGKRSLSGVKLEVGGEGMLAFYDKIVPAAANKLLAKLGGEKVGEVRIPKTEAKAEPDWAHVRSMASQVSRGVLDYDEFRSETDLQGFVTDADLEALHSPYQRGATLGVVNTFVSTVRARIAAGKNMKQLGFDVTDALRARAQSGLPLFQTKGFTTREVQVDGKWRSIDNSKGQLIATEFEHQAKFWRQFKDSPVVDAKGRPLVLYHGTLARSDFSEFSGGAGRVTYASPDPAYASRFASIEGGRVMPLYMALQEPLDARELGHKELTPQQVLDFLDDSSVKVNKELENRIRGYGKAEWWAHMRQRPEMVAAIQAAGYDGVIQQESVGDHAADAYVSFKPEQIKSATGNDGTFSAKDPDIRFAQRAPAWQGVYGDLTPAQEQALRNVGGIKQPETLADRWARLKQNLGLRIQQGVFDQFAPLRDLDPKAYMMARLSKGSEGTMEAALFYGKPFLRDGVPDVDVTDGGFAKVLATLKGEHDRFLWWVAAQRAERLKTEGRENLFTDRDISSLKTLADGQMADGSGRAQIYRDALQQLNDFNDAVLKVAEESGLIDAEARELFKGQPYVPFYRVMEDEALAGPRFSSGLVNQQAYKRLKGGQSQLNDDLLENMLLNWAHLYTAAARNRAAIAAIDSAQTLAIAYPTHPGAKDAVKVMREGVANFYNIEDPYLMEAVTALHYTPSPLMAPLAKMKKLLTFSVTVNPMFKVRNLLRDSVSAMAQSDLSYNPLKNVAQGWKAAGPDSQTYASMLASGGVMRFGSLEETERVRARIEKLGGKLADETQMHSLKMAMEQLWEVYNELGDRSENANRTALYEQLIAKGKTHAEASYLARDLMDFSMSGKWPVVRFLTQTVPFLNARLQGLYKLGRSAKEDPLRFAAVTGAVALASLALMAFYGDDDDWKRREDWDRDNYWWFKIGSTAYRIPKPFEVGAIGTLAERSAELFFSKEMTSARFLDRLSFMASQTFSLNPIPQAFSPLVDVYANRDSFTRRPIESLTDEKVRPEDRYDERTSEIGRLLGAIGMPEPLSLLKGEYKELSPKQFDFLLQGYFSWMGSTIAAVTDYGVRPLLDRGERPERKMGVGMVQTLPAGGSRYVTAFYEQAREIEQAYASYRAALREGNQAKADRIAGEGIIQNHVAAGRVRNRMDALSAQSRAIERNTDLSAADKRQRIDQINELRNQLAQTYVTRTKP